MYDWFCRGGPMWPPPSLPVCREVGVPAQGTDCCAALLLAMTCLFEVHVGRDHWARRCRQSDLPEPIFRITGTLRRAGVSPPYEVQDGKHPSGGSFVVCAACTQPLRHGFAVPPPLAQGRLLGTVQFEGSPA